MQYYIKLQVPGNRQSVALQNNERTKEPGADLECSATKNSKTEAGQADWRSEANKAGGADTRLQDNLHMSRLWAPRLGEARSAFVV